MATKKQKAIYKIALQYQLDGNSLDAALFKAVKHYGETNKKVYKLSEASANEVMQMLVAKNKKTLFKIEKAEKAFYRQISKFKKSLQRTDDANRIREEKRVNRLKLAEEKKLNAAKVAESKKRVRAIAKAESEAAKRRKKSFAGGFDSFGGKLGTISAYGAAISVINGVRQAITYAITKTIEFEKAFVDLSVKSGYTRDEMVDVSQAIYDVAASTAFSTMEIVAAATALGKLGFQAEETIKILPSLAHLAGATGSNLEESSKILGKVINAYSLTADHASIIADKMVHVFNNSALDIQSFNTAFSYVGAAAASTGTSFDELTGAMALLADRGITASKIGTGLRNVFTKMGEEGDTLRDILVRVNKEQLSFYEVAELVGNRAANQLLIMANNLEGFDERVASAADSFGAAMVANAKQMSTFSSRWDILINNMDNAIAGSDVNGWVENVREALGGINHISLVAEKHLSPEKAKRTQYIMNAIFGSNEVLIKNIKERKKILNESLGREATYYETIESLRRDVMARNDALPFAKSGEQIKEWTKNNKESDALLSLRDKGAFFENFMKTQEEAKKKDETTQFLEDKYQAFKAFYTKLNAQIKTQEANNIYEQMLKGDLSALDTYSDLLNERQEKLLRNEKKSIKEILDIRKKGGDQALIELYKTETEFSKITKARKESISGIDRMLGISGDDKRPLFDTKISGDMKHLGADVQESFKQLSASNARSLRDDIEKLAAENKSLCEKYPREAAMLGIECEAKKTSRRRTGKYERFEKLATSENAYNEEVSSLRTAFRNEDDPAKKMHINKLLLEVERRYRESLNQEYIDYLDRQARARNEFIRKNPDSKDAFDANIVSVTRAKGRDESKGVINEDKLLQEEINAKGRAFEKDIDKTAAYALRMKQIDNELKQLDRRDFKGRKKLRAEKNKLTDEYYEETQLALRKHGDALKEELERLIKLNETAENPIDLTKLRASVEAISSQSTKLETERVGAQDEGNRKENQDFDYFTASIQSFDEIAGLFTQIGDAKIELMQAQADRELEIIKKRNDEEKEITNSALAAGIISQEDAAAAEERANKRKIDKENKVAKALFDAKKKQDMQTAIFTGASSTAQAIARAFASNSPIEAAIFAAISSAAIAASTAMNVQAISKRKFVPQKYEDGGLVYGNSHARGGVPFTVKGKGGYEMEGGEFIVRKEAVKNNLAELERINGKTSKPTRKFATGGIVPNVLDNDGGLNSSILEALNRPVRAYVTDQDLAKSESERRALSKKSSY